MVNELTGWCGHQEAGSRPMESMTGGQGDKNGMLSVITSHCLPKLVCQLYSQTSRDHFTDSERNLMNMIGNGGMSRTPSKYGFAAHMGQLVRGIDGQGCHNFYPDCPFSNSEVMEMARRINFKWVTELKEKWRKETIIFLCRQLESNINAFSFFYCICFCFILT